MYTLVRTMKARRHENFMQKIIIYANVCELWVYVTVTPSHSQIFSYHPFYAPCATNIFHLLSAKNIWYIEYYAGEVKKKKQDPLSFHVFERNNINNYAWDMFIAHTWLCFPCSLCRVAWVCGLRVYEFVRVRKAQALKWKSFSLDLLILYVWSI